MKKVVNGYNVYDPSETYEASNVAASPEIRKKLATPPEGRLIEASGRFIQNTQDLSTTEVKARMHRFFKKEARKSSFRLTHHGPKMGGLWIA